MTVMSAMISMVVVAIAVTLVTAAPLSRPWGRILLMLSLIATGTGLRALGLFSAGAKRSAVITSFVAILVGLAALVMYLGPVKG